MHWMSLTDVIVMADVNLRSRCKQLLTLPPKPIRVALCIEKADDKSILADVNKVVLCSVRQQQKNINCI
jgi:hypothetical protein